MPTTMATNYCIRIILAAQQNFSPFIYVTSTDFDTLTRNGAYCDSTGGISAEGFEMIMREQAILLLSLVTRVYLIIVINID
jgi:hypothetical protein